MAVLLWIGNVAAQDLAPFTAAYALKRGGMKIGDVQRELRQGANGTLVLTSRSKPTGLAAMFVKDVIAESSTWIWHDKRPRPLEYTYDRSGGKRERHVKLTFDWETNAVTNDISGDAWKMEVPPEALDKLLYQLVLMLDLRTAADSFQYEIADGGKMKDYHFNVEGEETLNTALGDLQTRKLVRRRDDRTTTIWCAEAYGYLPVKIEQNEEDHGMLQLVIQAVTGIEKAP